MAEIPPVDTLEPIRDGLFVRFAQVAAGTLFVYDVLLNLDVELRHVWAALSLRRQRPIRVAPMMFNLLYVVQRYLPLWDRVILDTYYMLGPSNTNTCETTYKMSARGAIIGIILSECLLAMRIRAVWLNSPCVTAMLVVLALSCSIPGVFFFVRFARGIHCPELYKPGTATLQGCYCLMENKDLYLSWIVLMVVNIAGFIMMAIPGIKAYRRVDRSNLAKVVYQDGVIYYASILLASLINVVVILQLPSTFVSMVSPLERVLHSIISSHMVLHIREMAPPAELQHRDGITTGEFTTEHNEMSFVSNPLRSDNELENQGKQLRA
ncbi:hypothetical protein E1B28_002843 [Marasmius oreades]|uniref:DUF6533 domain-containing protein n=1 Tax=Marasmius oreades TaxID=181124 RepID=A0A9P7ULB5_9AGAR|nr:uncharacterized protein E1B28_002843 [Marasmius oreades]KAG7086927.1 hypothetical protein E1B28_002843 [Marasmius oreades]